MVNMLTVRPYIRVSTDEQAQEGFSIPAQRERIADFCRSQSWVIADWYIEEGKSAKDMDRPELSRLRADLRPGEIVVVYRLDRLTRSVLDLHTLLAEWEKRQVGFRSVTEVYDTTTAIGRLFITLVAALAQWERENLGERVKFGMTEMVKEGKWYGGPLPFGYRYDQAAGRLVPHPDQAPLVREIFRWYAAGEGARAIAIRLNDMRLHTNQGAAWSPFTVYWILRSEVYLGHTMWNKKGKGESIVVKDTHEPILSPAEWQAVADTLARHTQLAPREIASDYPLTGIARCGLCGARVSGRTQPRYDRKTKERRWSSRQYTCQARMKFKSCSLPLMAAEQLERALLERVAEIDDVDSLLQLAGDRPADPHEIERKQLEAELASLARKKRRWYSAYEEEAISSRDLAERTGQLTAREEAIRSRLAQIAPSSSTLDPEEVLHQLREFGWYWETGSVEERRGLLASLFEEVVVHPGYNVDLKLKPLRP